MKLLSFLGAIFICSTSIASSGPRHKLKDYRDMLRAISPYPLKGAMDQGLFRYARKEEQVVQDSAEATLGSTLYFSSSITKLERYGYRGTIVRKQFFSFIKTQYTTKLGEKVFSTKHKFIVEDGRELKLSQVGVNLFVITYPFENLAQNYNSYTLRAVNKALREELLKLRNKRTASVVNSKPLNPKTKRVSNDRNMLANGRLCFQQDLKHAPLTCKGLKIGDFSMNIFREVQTKKRHMIVKDDDFRVFMNRLADFLKGSDKQCVRAMNIQLYVAQGVTSSIIPGPWKTIVVIPPKDVQALAGMIHWACNKEELKKQYNKLIKDKKKSPSSNAQR